MDENDRKLLIKIATKVDESLRNSQEAITNVRILSDKINSELAEYDVSLQFENPQESHNRINIEESFINMCRDLGIRNLEIKIK